MQPLHELDINIDPVEWGPFRFYRWRLILDEREAYGRTWTYRGALRDVTATAKALRMLTVIDPELTGLDAA